MAEEKQIIIHDNEVKVAKQKSHLIAGFGFILFLFGLISSGYKSGRHGISDTFTWITLIAGVILIIVDFAKK